jgi:hypothetical protein
VGAIEGCAASVSNGSKTAQPSNERITGNIFMGSLHLGVRFALHENTLRSMLLALGYDAVYLQRATEREDP